MTIQYKTNSLGVAVLLAGQLLDTATQSLTDDDIDKTQIEGMRLQSPKGKIGIRYQDEAFCWLSTYISK